MSQKINYWDALEMIDKYHRTGRTMNIKKFKMGVDLGKGDYSVKIIFEKVGSIFIIRRIVKGGYDGKI